MSSEYTNIHIAPPLERWENRLTAGFTGSDRLLALRRAARKRLISEAQKFVARLASIADDADLPDLSTSVLTGDPTESPIVMTGHQPVVFHSGLTFKYDVTAQFAADSHAIGVAVVIDTDQGDAGQFSYPDPDSARPNSAAIAIDSLTESNRLYSHAKLRPLPEIQMISDNLRHHLTALEQDRAARSATHFFDQLIQLGGVTTSAMEANLVTRWLAGIGDRLLELPLSAITAFPESLTLTADILKQPLRFAAAYNSALNVFRQENNIKNPANPFPDLKTDSDGCELPFWVINHDAGRRQALEVRLDGNVTHLTADGTVIDTFAGNITAEALEPMLLQNLQLVPRGALITAYLRLLFADLFVHGTGGGRYDSFTNEFIRSWWNVEPTGFTVASASRYLFADQRNRIQDLEGIQKSLRDLRFNPQRHLGTGVFTGELESRLKKLLQVRDTLIAELKTARENNQSGQSAGIRMQAVTAEIKSAVDSEFEPQLDELQQWTPEQLDAVNCRTYPWFFFSDGGR